MIQEVDALRNLYLEGQIYAVPWLIALLILAATAATAGWLGNLGSGPVFRLISRALLAVVLMIGPGLGLARAVRLRWQMETHEPSERAMALGSAISQAMNCTAAAVLFLIVFYMGIATGRLLRRVTGPPPTP